jgi:hypothetical protein
VDFCLKRRPPVANEVRYTGLIDISREENERVAVCRPYERSHQTLLHFALTLQESKGFANPFSEVEFAGQQYVVAAFQHNQLCLGDV